MGTMLKDKGLLRTAESRFYGLNMVLGGRSPNNPGNQEEVLVSFSLHNVFIE